jgi:exonuclease SbcC
MRLTSIDIANFRVFHRAHLSLGDTVVGIVGPNGAGKSSIVEAVAWALYGNPVVRSSKDEIKSTFASPADTCEVSLSFAIRGEQYRVVRRLVGKTERPEVMLYRGGGSESVGSTETNRLIVDLLGLDWRGFLTSFLARQQELNALAELPPSQRREHLAGMLGIQILDRAIQKAKETSRLQSMQIDLLQRESARAGDLGAHLEQTREHAAGIRLESDRATTALVDSRRQFAELEAAYREHQRIYASCSALSGQLTGLKSTRDHLASQLAALHSTLSDLLKGADELQRLEECLVRFEPLKQELVQLEQVRRQAVRSKELLGQIETAGSEVAELKTKLEVVTSDLKELVREMTGTPADIESQHAEALVLLERAREDWSKCRSSADICKQEIERVAAQIKAVSEIGPETVCDRCGRPYGKDLPAIREHLNTELSAAKARRELAQQDLTCKQAEGEALKVKAAELESQVRRRWELTVRHGTLEKQHDQLAGIYQAAVGRLEDLRVQHAALGEVVIDSERLERVSAEVAELEKVNRQALELTGRVSALRATRERLDQVHRQLEDCDRHIEDLEARIRDLDFDQHRFDTLAAEFTSHQQKVEEKQQVATRLSRELELVEQEIELKGQELLRLEQAVRELEECRTSQFYTEKLGGLFTDFRKYTISRIRPRLAELSSELMAEMSGGRYSLVELDPDYNIQVMDYGSYYGVERFSGGEKDLASLCLRLAISLALTESAGLDGSFVILDEVFGSQDSNRRESILQALANLKNRFPQMILITHLDEFKHKVETLIEVRPTGSGWSEVIVDGRTS